MPRTLGSTTPRHVLFGPPSPLHPPGRLDAVERFLAQHQIRSAHYYGDADPALLYLLTHVEGLALSVMDLADRFGSGVRFFADEFEPVPFDRLPKVPEWLENVPFYQEGFPFDIECWIQDVPPRPWQIETIRPLPKEAPDLRAILLLGQPPCHDLAPGFEWNQTAGLSIGLRPTER